MDMTNEGMVIFDADARPGIPERHKVQTLEEKIKTMIEEARSYISALMWLLADDHRHGDNTYDAWTERRIAQLNKYIEYLQMCLMYGEEPMEFEEFLNSSYCRMNCMIPASYAVLSREEIAELEILKKRLRTMTELEPGTDCSVGREGIVICMDRIMQRILEIEGKLEAAPAPESANEPAKENGSHDKNGIGTYARMARRADDVRKSSARADDSGSMTCCG